MKVKKWLSVLLSLAMLLSMFSFSAFAEEGKTYKDGTYTGTGTVKTDEVNYDDYEISVMVTVANGVITNVAFSDDCVIEDEDNADYCDKAMDGTRTKTGMAEKIVSANGTAGVDAVSGATYSSAAIIQAVDAALTDAVDTSGGGDDGDDALSVSLGASTVAYQPDGTTVALSVSGAGFDADKVAIGYSAGRFNETLTAGTDYSVADDGTVTILASGGYNKLGQSLTVSYDGKELGTATIRSTATVRFDGSKLTLAGGNGETLETYLDAITDITVNDTEYQTVESQKNHNPNAVSDFFDADGSVVLGEYIKGGDSISITASGFDAVSGTVGSSSTGGEDEEVSSTITVPAGLKDGNYTATVRVDPDDAADGSESFNFYNITVTVKVEGGKIDGISVTGATGQNTQYSYRAETGINGQISGSGAGTYDVDMVSMATCSSVAIVEAVNKALQGEPVGNTTLTLGDAIYVPDGTPFTVTVTDPEEDVDYSDIALSYAVGKFADELTKGTDYTVELVSESDSQIVYRVTVLNTEYEIEDDSAGGFERYNELGRNLDVTVAGTSAGRVVISSGATVTLADDRLTLTGGNGETLKDYLATVGTITISYTGENGETVEDSYTTKMAHDVAPTYCATDVFNEETGAVKFDCAAFEKGASGVYTITSEAEGFHTVTGTVGGSVYVLMNIPYADFYAAEGTSAVDAVSSATLNKTRTGNLAGGSYHVNSDGSDITGITYPVKVSAEEFEKLQALGYDVITDGSSVTITVTNRGQTSETTYTGSDALFEAASYSYYVLSEAPDYYKTLTVSDEGGMSFGAAVGERSTLPNVTATVTTETSYGDYQIDLNGLPESIGTVYGVLLTTAEGGSYGLRHVENIWRGYELAWSVGYTTTVHGCSVSYEPYVSTIGQTVKQITYYTDAGIYTIDCELALTPYYDGEVTAAAADENTIDLYGLPEDIEDAKVTVYYMEGEGRQAKQVNIAEAADIENGSVPVTTPMETDKEYTVYITSGNYAQITASVALADTLYVRMNLPYADFYAAEGIAPVGEQVDVISTATTSKFLGTNGLAAGTYNDGTNISGVVYPVALSLEDYNAVKELAVENGDYAIVGVVSDPAAYMQAAVADGKISFELVAEDKDSSGLSVGNFTTTSSYGSYQIDLTGVTPGSSINGEDLTIAGVILTTSDDETYAMYMLENIWVGTRVENVELAWSVLGAHEVYKNHGNGPAFYQYDMNGKTLTNVKIITDIGVYSIDCDLELTPYYEGEISAEATGATAVAVSGLPVDLEHGKVSVYYTEGSGRNMKKIYLVENADLIDGSVTLAEAMEEGKEYTVYVTSDNYAQMTTTVTYTAPTAPGTTDPGATTPGTGTTNPGTGTTTPGTTTPGTGTTTPGTTTPGTGTTAPGATTPGAGTGTNNNANTGAGPGSNTSTSTTQSVKTGDEAPLILWVSLMLLCMGVLSVLAVRHIRRKKQ